MNGIGPELPLSRDDKFGVYSLITSYKEEVKQNFKKRDFNRSLVFLFGGFFPDTRHWRTFPYNTEVFIISRT